VLVAEQLCDTADIRAGWHVLDVATGSGNAAIAAARDGANTTPPSPRAASLRAATNASSALSRSSNSIAQP
jgi:predicted nicotinamide N-methyase